ncbi:MAG: hypothetical protein AB1668_02730 [Nanoarchaeota archaeon]
MEFWNTLITEKSWNVLQRLTKKPFRFILIGGWAAYMWTKLHKSKDVDIIVDDYNSLEYLKRNFDLRKNDQLKKYEIKIEEIDIDIYVPFYSQLPLSIEEIKKQSTKIENITVVRPEILLILKQQAELERMQSIKGQKDRIDIMALLCFAPINFSLYLQLLDKYHLAHLYERLKKIITQFSELKHLGLNPREYKKKKEALLGQLKKG